MRRWRPKGAKVIDAACPNVTKIHRLVEKAEQEGRQPVIIGTPDHPEVVAIAGWCRRPVVLAGAEAGRLAVGTCQNIGKNPTLVSQTTSHPRNLGFKYRKNKKTMYKRRNF